MAVDVPSHALPKALFRGLLPQAHSARTASVRVLRIVPSPPEPEPLGRQPTTEAGEEGFDALERAGAASAKRSAGADATEPTGLHRGPGASPSGHRSPRAAPARVLRTGNPRVRAIPFRDSL